MPIALSLRDGAAAPAHPAPAWTPARAGLAVAIVPMVAVTIALGLTGDHLAHPVTAAVYWAYLIAASMAVGLYWWRQRPASRFGPLLVAFGVLVWVVSWENARAPLAFDLGVLAEGPFFVVTFYLFLAFPMGRVEPRAARWLMLALVAGVVGFFLPWALFSPVIAGGGPLSGCAPDCPENALQIASAPNLVDVAGKAEIYAALAVTVGVLVVYLQRLSLASRPQRRALMAVAITSLLFLPAYFVFNFAAWVLYLDSGTLMTLQWGVVVARVLLPLGFLVALLQAQGFATRATRTLVERLATRPTPQRWRDMVADALDDPELRLGYLDPGSGEIREPGGETLPAPVAGDHRAWVPIARHGQPVAAMVVDETLAEDPELVRAAASATLVAVENGALEGVLRDAERAAREQIGRDLHDGAQQRLVGLRIHLALLGERLSESDEQALVERLGDEVDQTLDDLREIAGGRAPALLEAHGVGTALKAAARGSPVRVSVYDSGIGRPSHAIETTIYYCCLESLQNAAKHAGPDAAVSIRLARSDGWARFSIEDDGAGFDPAAVVRGAGLANMSRRLTAIGGRLEVETRAGAGTRVSGDVPL